VVVVVVVVVVWFWPANNRDDERKRTKEEIKIYPVLSLLVGWSQKKKEMIRDY